MISRYTHHGLTWIDLESPTREELLHIGEEFGLAKHIEETLFSPTPLQTVDVYDTSISLTLPCPAVQSNGTAVSVHSLTTVIGKKYLITAHQNKIAAVQAFGSLFEHVEKPDHYSATPTDGPMLFAELMKHLYIIALQDLEHIKNRIHTIEHALLSTNTEQLLRGIVQTERTLLTFKEALIGHAVLLATYTSACMQCFGEEAVHTVKHIQAEYTLVYNAIEAQCSTISSLHHAQIAHLTATNNTRLKTLIILAIIIILLTLITLII